MYKTILVVDDEESICQSLQGILTDEGYEVRTVGSGEEALKAIEEDPPDLALLDIWLPGMDGLEALKIIKTETPQVQVIMMSGHGTIETAVKATKLGAFDFIEKPISLEKVVLLVNHALDLVRLEEENKFLKQKVTSAFELIGQSKSILDLKEMIRIVAPTNAWILIMGENGTGKELVARSIHYQSKRAKKPFIEVNCAAIPEELIESELFGHEKGSFTGATAKKRGKFELAHEGTLFLDEVADMSLKAQAKILRILQEKRYERVGGNKFIDTDVRVLAATNKDLEKEMEADRFRQDLYYRLNVIPLTIAPLRDRKEDIPILASQFVKDFCLKEGVEPKAISEDSHRYPDRSQLARERAGAQEYHGAPRHHDAGRYDHGRRHPASLEGGAARGGHGLDLHPQFLPEGEDGIRKEVHPEKAPGKRGQHLQDGRLHRTGAKQPPPQDQNAQPGI